MSMVVSLYLDFHFVQSAHDPKYQETPYTSPLTEGVRSEMNVCARIVREFSVRRLDISLKESSCMILYRGASLLV